MPPNSPNKRDGKGLSQLLGNFAILTSKASPRAAILTSTKRQAIFGTKRSNVFPLTADLVNYSDWNEENIPRGATGKICIYTEEDIHLFGHFPHPRMLKNVRSSGKTSLQLRSYE